MMKITLTLPMKRPLIMFKESFSFNCPPNVLEPTRNGSDGVTLYDKFYRQLYLNLLHWIFIL